MKRKMNVASVRFCLENCNYFYFLLVLLSFAFSHTVFFPQYQQKTTINETDWIAVGKHSTQIGGYGKLNEEQLRILDDVPSSAVELQAKDKASGFFRHSINILCVS